jgi:hypothetical protein
MSRPRKSDEFDIDEIRIKAAKGSTQPLPWHEDWSKPRAEREASQATTDPNPKEDK